MKKVITSIVSFTVLLFAGCSIEKTEAIPSSNKTEITNLQNENTKLKEELAKFKNNSNTNSTEITKLTNSNKQLQKKLTTFEKENKALKTKVSSFEKVESTRLEVQDIGVQFFKYMSTNDYTKLKPLLANNSNLKSNGTIIFQHNNKPINYEYSGFNIYDNVEFAKIRGFGFIENNLFVVHYELQRRVASSSESAQPFVIHLYFKKENNEWKIAFVENDI